MLLSLEEVRVALTAPAVSADPRFARDGRNRPRGNQLTNFCSSARLLGILPRVLKLFHMAMCFLHQGTVGIQTIISTYRIFPFCKLCQQNLQQLETKNFDSSIPQISRLHFLTGDF